MSRKLKIYSKYLRYLALTAGLPLLTLLPSCKPTGAVAIPEAKTGGGSAQQDNADQTPVTTPSQSTEATITPTKTEASTDPITTDPVGSVPVTTEPMTTIPVADPITKTDPVVTPVVTPTPTPVPLVKKYTIVGEGSGRCITAPETAGTLLTIHDCTSAANQQFTLEEVASTKFKIVAHKNMVIELRGDNAYDLTMVQVGNYANKASQWFKIEAKNYTAYNSISIFGTSVVLDAAYKGTANGTEIMVYGTSNPASNQKWMIKEVK